MNDERNPTDDARLSRNAAAAPASLSADAADRRRLLLKGVGRGGALLTATAPLKTLAGQHLLTSDAKHLCTVSGMQSGVHSASPGTSQICTGFIPDYYGQSTDGNKTPCHAWPVGVNCNADCVSVFKYCSLKVNRKNATLFQVVNAFGSTDDAHWVCAWLNARLGNLNFPYAADQVLNYYNAKDPNALAFFKGFMETRAS